MSERTEGPLSDPGEQKKKESADRHLRRVSYGDLRDLEKQDAFRRWFGKWAETTVMFHLKTNNGGDLQEFSGRRNLVLEMVREFDVVVPGFYERVLAARRRLAQEVGLRQEPPAEQE